MKRIMITLFATYCLVLLAICPPTLVAQTEASKPDPRGKGRYTLTGEEWPTSQVFTIKKYDPSNKDFFEGYGRKTVKELVLSGSKVYIEFGLTTKGGYVSDDAVIIFPNGLQWDEAYLDGCRSADGKFIRYNRIKFLKKPDPPKAEETCTDPPGLPTRLVPSSWTIDRSTPGQIICKFTVPTPPPPQPQPTPIDNTCYPGSDQRIFEHSSEKLFDPSEVVRTKVDGTKYDIPKIVGKMYMPAGIKGLTHLVVYYDGCNYSVFGLAVMKSGGLSKWWLWLIPVAFVAGILIGHLSKNCDCIIPTEVAKTSTTSVPGTPRRRP